MRRLALLAGFVAAWAGCSAAGALELTDQDRQAISLANSLMEQGRRPEGHAALDSLLAASLRRGDPALQLAVLVTKGGHYSWTGQAREAEPLLTEAVQLAEARRESTLYCQAAMWLGHSLLAQSRRAEAETLLRQALPIAARVGDREREGFMCLSLASVELAGGRFEDACAAYATARQLLHETGNRFGELDALTGMGRAYQEFGDLGRARTCYEAVAERAGLYGLRENEADAYNNLGVNEFLRGDPALALGHFQEALRIREALGNVFNMIIPATNVARALSDLGRIDDAEAELDSLLAVCQERGFVDMQASILEALASIRMERGDHEGALDVSRRILSLGEAPSIVRRMQGYLGSARALAAMNRVGEAVEILEGPACRNRTSLPADIDLEYESMLGECLLEIGRHEDATAAALRADREAERLSRTADRVAALTVASMAEIRLGREGDAGRHLDLAIRLWEQVRTLPSEFEWRERRAGYGRLFSTAVGHFLGALYPAPSAARIRAAFDAAQRFKTRTLLERIQRSRADFTIPQPTANLETLQREVLRDGEVLVDFLVGEETSYVFAVTRDTCSAAVLPGVEELVSRVDRFRDFLATPVRQGSNQLGERYATAGEEIGLLLLGPVAPVIETAHRVFFSPDGPLYALPFDALRLPRVDPLGGRNEPMGLRAVVSRIPSATLLALARTRGDGQPPQSGFRGLAVPGGSTPGRPPLRGAREEVARLGRFAGMQIGLVGADSTPEKAMLSLQRYTLLHFAGHTELDDQYPWRSAVVLQPPGEAEGAWAVHADEIAALALDSRLVVLSGCESAGGSAIYGEGLQGLSSAFLAAGAQTLVATLWPVDDRSMALLMAHFYDNLGRGAPVGEALRAAKRRLASSPESAAPFFWAGVLLIGEPDSQLALRLRRSTSPVAWTARAAFLLTATGLAVVVFRRLSRRRCVTQAPPERQSP